jgi:Flp pilus assembly protein TadB
MDALHAAAFEDTPPMASAKARIPEGLQRVVARCLRKNPEERYPDARSLAEDLRKLRRDTESRLSQKTSWRQRFLDGWEELRQMPPSQYWWYGLGLAVGLLALYLSVEKIGTAGMFFLGLAALYVYRHVRNRRQRVQERFVKRVRKIPEVRLIAIQGNAVKVVVDRPAGELYGRINDAIRAANSRLYYGEPMTCTILPDQAPEDYRQLLASPGVNYVRDDQPA